MKATTAILAALAVAALAGCAPAPARVPSGAPSAKEPTVMKIPGWPDDMRGVNIILWSISEDDLDHLAGDWKANSVRLMCNDLVLGKPPYDLNREKLDKLYTVVDWCRKRGLYVVINQQPPGWRRRPDDFWKNEALQASYLRSWVEIAERYAATGDGIAYDLFNEPHGKGCSEAWPRIAKELTAALREVDTVHPIVIEPPSWGNSVGFDTFEPTGDDRTVYSFHFYAPFDFTHQRGKGGTLKATPEGTKAMKYPGVITPWWEGAKGEQWDRDRIAKEIAPALAFRKKHGVRLWIGEFGVTRWANGAGEWLGDCLATWEENGIGSCYYSYREWHAMDIEKPSGDRRKGAPRTETDMVRLFKSYLARSRAE